MTIQSPLAVRLSIPGQSHAVDVRDLSFTKNARGGHESATFDLPEWVNTNDPVLSVEAKCRIQDKRNGHTIWEGYLGQPGRTIERASGHVWQVGVIGAMSILGDRSRPYVAIDGLDSFYRKNNGAPGSTGSIGSLPADDTVPAVIVQFPGGQPIDNNSHTSMYYGRIRDAGQKIGGVGYSVISGQSSPGGNYVTESFVTNAAGSSDTLHSDNMSLVDSTPSTASAGGSAFGTARDALTLRLSQVSGGATNVSTDNVWSAFHDVFIRALFKDKTGTVISGTGTYANPYVLAHEVIIDALQWFAPLVDTANASIDTTFTHHIDQLAYDTVRLPQMLDDLALLEPDITWGVGESNPATGLHRAWVGKYPSAVRYVATTRDGWTAPGAEAQLANHLSVSFTDRRGQDQHPGYGSVLPALDQWGRVRDAEQVQLSTEIGSLAAAGRIGTALLIQLNAVAAAGTLTVARPIRDLFTGQDVWPWEIEPGYLMRVRGSGEMPMRLSQMSYTSSSQSASLTLGTPVYTAEELVNKLARRRTRHGGSQVPLTIT